MEQRDRKDDYGCCRRYINSIKPMFAMFLGFSRLICMNESKKVINYKNSVL